MDEHCAEDIITVATAMIAADTYDVPEGPVEALRDEFDRGFAWLVPAEHG